MVKSSSVRLCDHVGFFTNDAERLVEFYCATLDFAVVKEEVLPATIMRSIFGLSSPCRLIKLAAPSGSGTAAKPLRIEIFHPTGLKLPRRRNAAVGCNHCSFSVENRERFLRRLRSRGVSLIQVRRNGHTVFFIKDPDGNRIEIRD